MEFINSTKNIKYFRTLNRRNFEPITPEMDEDIDSWLAFPSSPAMTLVTINNVNIEVFDIATLKPYVWLNDVVINTVLYLITCDSPTSFYLNTHFIGAYQHQGYDRVRRWTKKIDPGNTGELFSKRMLFIPIHAAGGSHWALVAINMVEKTITYYCSKKWSAEVILKSSI